MSTSVDSLRGSPTQPPGFLQNALIGNLSGVIMSCIIQPGIGAKSAVQRGEPIPRNMRVLCRGLGGAAASLGPTTGIQTGVEGFLTEREWNAFCAAATAGVVSALFIGPTELIMIQQQKTGKN